MKLVIQLITVLSLFFLSLEDARSSTSMSCLELITNTPRIERVPEHIRDLDLERVVKTRTADSIRRWKSKNYIESKVYITLKPFFRLVRALIERLSGRKAPALLINDGIAVDVRVLIKRGEIIGAEQLQKINFLISRYNSYAHQIENIIRTTEMKVENYLIYKRIRDNKEQNYPVKVRYGLRINQDGSIVLMDRNFNSRTEVIEAMKDYQHLERDRFNFTNTMSNKDLAYLYGRSREQAEIRGKLEYILKEFERFSDVYFTDRDIYLNTVNDIDKALKNRALMPLPASMFLYERIITNEEVLDFYKFRGNERTAKGIDLLTITDLTDLGLVQGRHSILRMSTRYLISLAVPYLVITGPINNARSEAIYRWNLLRDEAKVMTEVVTSESQRDYEATLKRFINTKYGIDLEVSFQNLPKEVLESVQIIQQERQKYLEEQTQLREFLNPPSN